MPSIYRTAFLVTMEMGVVMMTMLQQTSRRASADDDHDHEWESDKFVSGFWKNSWMDGQ